MKLHQQGQIAIHIYSDSRPHHAKSTAIQKGLILFYADKEVCGEGIGFGAPVVKYADGTYFPKDAALSVSDKDGVKKVVKVFEINGIFRLKLLGRYINSRVVSSGIELFSKVHRDYRHVRKLLDVILAFLRRCMGRPAELVQTASQGRIAVSYKMRGDSIIVQVDTSQLNKTDCQEICIMNEQGADFFRKYRDTNGAVMIDGQISSWEQVTAEAAFFSDLQDRVSFGLSNRSGVDLYLGRERFAGHLAWAGLAYSLPPELDTFEYRIKLQVENPNEDEGE